MAEHGGENVVVDRHAEKREACDQHAGDRARLEGDLEAGGQADRGGLGRAHVGADGDVHADEAGRTGKNGADQEPDGGGRGQKKPGGDEDDDADDCDGLVLAGQVSLRALPDIASNFLHAGVPLIGGKHRPRRPDGINHREQPACDNAQ